ncbi:MAG: glutathione peroxidase [Bdellovibrionota bacterium]
MPTNITEIPVKKIDGTQTSLADYKGKVMLVVNVASKCGLTPQYDGLEKIYENYSEKGLVVLGFPANEFLGQEPGTNEEIQDFCRSNFGVKFPMFQKIVVKGEGQHPLYKALTEVKPEAKTKPGGTLVAKLKEKGLINGNKNDIMWNFEKFLINRKGEVVERFAPDVTPDDPMVIQAIEKELAN